MSMVLPLCEVRDLRMVRDGRSIVEGVTLNVAPRTIHVVVGPNGGGKSSVLEALLGEAPFSGTARFHFRGNGSIGYVPQTFLADPTLPITVAEFLALSRQLLPVCLGVRGPMRARIAALLERVGLVGVAGRRLGALSGGELKRVLLANALDPTPELLVLDEPSTGLDAASATRLESIVREERDVRGTTVLMVSHDVAQVRRLADAVTWIDRTVLREGPPEAVFAKDAE
jgi:zinc transport system ATP-binding protein